MKLKWQWFLGGRIMFWASIITFIIFVFNFAITYVIDLTTIVNMEKQNVDVTSIKELSEKYLASLNIKIDAPITYRFVRYRGNSYVEELDSQQKILLGTFHKWNSTYYIDISVDLCKMCSLESTVQHEVRHMIVEYLKDKKIVDLTKYSEEIASEKNIHYNYLFEQGVYLLKEYQKESK